MRVADDLGLATIATQRRRTMAESVSKPGRAADENVVATFCFVDIAGYTALTDSHGERAAADLVEAFNSLVHSAVDPYGRVQERSGDNAFLVFPDPVVAMQAIGALHRGIAGRRDFPLVRSGLHHGSALLRANRYFGSSVNIAARTAAQAHGGEILCTRQFVDALAALDSASTVFEHRGLFTLKNLPDPVDLYAIRLTDAGHRYAIDPVCQMQVDTLDAASTLVLLGRHWWFCSSACAKRFAKQPSAFVRQQRQSGPDPAA
jgi:adenylate cyclase